MDFNTEENRQVLIDAFPNLAKDPHFELLSEATNVYNCIAWAMGFNDRWVDHLEYPGHWWPNNVQRDNSLQALIDAFVAEGFEQVEGKCFEEGFEKVALYKKDNSWTHAARIVGENIEYSKFGSFCDGKHSGNIFCGSGYGEEYAYLRRAIEKKPSQEKTKGEILLHLENLKL